MTFTLLSAFPVTEAWNLLYNLWVWMGNTYIINVAEISITFKQLLVYTTLFSIVALTVKSAIILFVGE